MKPTLVTGATGFLGKHLIAQWKRGAGETGRLRVLARGPTSWDNDPQVEVIRGDITWPADVLRAMDGAGRVFHLAGIVSRDPKNTWPLYRAHVEGTRNILEAALQHKPEKILVVSSSGTIAVSREPVVHDENSGYKNDIAGEWPYYLSKIFAEKLAFSYVCQHQLPIVVVNPSLLLGPGDERRSSTGDVLLFLKGQIKAVPPGGLNFVDVRDVAASLLGAMTAGRVGERYLLGGTNWTFRELLAKLSEISGVPAPRLNLPLRAARLGASILRGVYPLFGRLYELDDASVQMSACFWYCDSAKARRELDFRPRDPLETLRDTVDDIRRRMAV